MPRTMTPERELEIRGAGLSTPISTIQLLEELDAERAVSAELAKAARGMLQYNMTAILSLPVGAAQRELYSATQKAIALYEATL